MRLGVFGGGRLGALSAGQVYDISDLAPATGTDGPLAALIRSGTRVTLDGRVGVPVEEVAWEAPLPRPGKILGAPANYYDHADEMPDSATIVDWGMFVIASTSVIGPEQTVQLPYHDKRTDYEGELAVVIGKGGKNIALADALDHVYGYTVAMDITVRSTEDRSTRKSFDTFTPLGPWVVTADEIGDPATLELSLTLNGETRQRVATSKMIYGVEEIIAYASSVMQLEPGDVIATGTPAGVGQIADGDRIVATVDRIGSIGVHVSADNAGRYEDRPGPKTALQRQ